MTVFATMSAQSNALWPNRLGLDLEVEFVHPVYLVRIFRFHWKTQRSYLKIRGFPGVNHELLAPPQRQMQSSPPQCQRSRRPSPRYRSVGYRCTIPRRE